MARTRTRPVEKSESSAPARVNNADVAVDEAGRSEARSKPSTRDDKPRNAAATRGGFLRRIPGVRGIVAYFAGVVAEMQKVTWPSREETMRLTGVVLAVTVAFSLGLGLLDTFFGWWFQQAFHSDSEDIFLVIAVAVTVVCGALYGLYTWTERQASG